MPFLAINSALLFVDAVDHIYSYTYVFTWVPNSRASALHDFCLYDNLLVIIQRLCDRKKNNKRSNKIKKC